MKVMMSARVRNFACLTLMMGFLAACGGGGSDPVTPPVPPTPIPTPNTAPTANAGPDQTVNEGVTVLLAGSGSDAEGAVTYAWTQLSGPTVTLSSTTITNPTFIAPLVNATTTIQLRLTVTDSASVTATDTIVITVNDVAVANTPPTANAGADQTVNEGATVSLAGSGSDVESSVTYLWTQVSGPTITLSSTITVNPTFTTPMVIVPTTAIELRLTVTDLGGLTASDTVIVTVTDVPVVASGRVLQIAAGAVHMCALLDTQSLKCWGGGSGGLGLGDTNSRGDQPGEMGANLLAVNLGTGRYAVDMALGAVHSCARLDNGEVKCWGNNAFGQLGLGDIQTRGDQPGEMGDALLPVNLGTGRTALELAVGVSFTCARLDNSTTKCWGFIPPIHNPANINSGDAPGEMGDALPILNFGSGLTAVQLAAPALGAFACARLNTGAVKCWGSSSSAGQLGTGSGGANGLLPQDMGNNLQPVNLGTGRTAVDIIAAGNAGRGTVCAILDNGATKCWGDNGDDAAAGSQLNSGLLGQGDTADRGDQANELGDNLLPINFGTSLSAQSLGLGTHIGCAILTDQTLKCWGNYFGLGNGAFPSFNFYGDQPNEMGTNLPIINLGTKLSASGPVPLTAVQVAVSTYSVCALLDTGAVKCWGGNNSGEAGQGHTNPIGWQPNQMGNNLTVVPLGL